MATLAEVEQAKALMNEALEWSVVRWLKEKKRVRKAADRANDTLDRELREIKSRWSPDLLAVHAEVAGAGPPNGGPAGDELRAFAREFQRTHDDARRARQEAEDVFDEAERELSSRLAREGCRKAIRSWELHEKAIRKAESGLQATLTR